MRSAILAVLLASLVATGCACKKKMGDMQTGLKTLAEKQDKDQTEIKVQLELLRGELQELKDTQSAQAEELKALARKAPPPRPAYNRPDPEAVYAVPIGNAPIRGRTDGLVTIVEISDFQCPFCQRVQRTLSQLLDEYSQELRLVFLHNPLAFHKRAMPAAIAAECAGEQDKFWQMHDRLFENVRALEDEDIKAHAASIPGLNKDVWKGCFLERLPKKRIEQDQATAARIGARGTPAFFINGRILSGAQPIDRFRALIDEELKKAKNSGIPRESYYQKVVEEGGREKF